MNWLVSALVLAVFAGVFLLASIATWLQARGVRADVIIVGLAVLMALLAGALP